MSQILKALGFNNFTLNSDPNKVHAAILGLRGASVHWKIRDFVAAVYWNSSLFFYNNNTKFFECTNHADGPNCRHSMFPNWSRQRLPVCRMLRTARLTPDITIEVLSRHANIRDWGGSNCRYFDTIQTMMTIKSKNHVIEITRDAIQIVSNTGGVFRMTRDGQYQFHQLFTP